MAVLYSLAAITPDTEFGLSFYDYFTEEERFALWRVANLREYLPKINSAPSRGLSIDMAKPLMRQLLGSAQEAVNGGEVCAALRFGHGEDTMPLSVILEVADPYYDREDSAPIAATKSPYAGHEAPARSGDRLLIPETARTHGSRPQFIRRKPCVFRHRLRLHRRNAPQRHNANFAPDEIGARRGRTVNVGRVLPLTEIEIVLETVEKVLHPCIQFESQLSGKRQGIRQARTHVPEIGRQPVRYPLQ